MQTKTLFKNRFFLRGNNLENFILLASVISLILEMFPIKSSCSIFSTYNATYITLITSIILSHLKKWRPQFMEKIQKKLR